MSMSIELLPPRVGGVEIVEHKGLGHPDTICDALAEELSRAYSRWTLERFGRVLHHNVDKALLCGGSARAWFGGGEVTAPIEILLAGRAVADVGGVHVPIGELAVEGSRTWLRRNMRALDVDRHVTIACKVRPGSIDLTELFAQSHAGRALANDTSCGAGFAPASALERAVLACADRLRSMARAAETPYVGDDVKVMGVRRGDAFRLTVACAFIAAHVPSRAAYAAARDRVIDELARVAGAEAGGAVSVTVNAADDLARDRAYLTVTGTSAEAGDDGQVGRGNRVNRLITPCRPMTLEAAAGKNPITHVGKLYQLAARSIAEAVVRSVPSVEEAHCFLVSDIGRPIDDPAVAELRVRTPDRVVPPAVAREIEAVARDGIARVGTMWRAVLSGEIGVV